MATIEPHTSCMGRLRSRFWTGDGRAPSKSAKIKTYLVSRADKSDSLLAWIPHTLPHLVNNLLPQPILL